MRFLTVLMLGCSLGLFADTARAQETRLVGEAVTASEIIPAPRTPTLVLVNEAVKSAPDASTGATPKAAIKSSTVKAAPATTPTMVAAQPIVMSGAPASATVESVIETTGNPKYDEYIKAAAARNGIDPNLIISVMRQESGFNSRARSYKGASGLMQLMPGTAARFGVTNIYDPQQNIEGGARYLRFLLDQFNGDIALVLAGYNAGENAVVNSGYRVPRYRETQAYVKSISARYDRVKSSAARSKAATSAQAAPTAETFSGGRLSNNY